MSGSSKKSIRDVKRFDPEETSGEISPLGPPKGGCLEGWVSVGILLL